MAKKTVGAVLESSVGLFSTSVHLPVRRNSELKFEWNAKNEFRVTVPTKIEFKDDFNNVVVFHENYAKFLLENYKHLKFVEEVTEDEFEAKPFEKFAPKDAVVELKVETSSEETKVEEKKENKKGK